MKLLELTEQLHKGKAGIKEILVFQKNIHILELTSLAHAKLNDYDTGFTDKSINQVQRWINELRASGQPELVAKGVELDKKLNVW